MMSEQNPGKLFKQAGKPTVFSDLKGLGLKVSLSGKTAKSFSIDPFHPANVPALYELAGRPKYGKPILLFPKGEPGKAQKLSAFAPFVRRNALAAVNSGAFLGVLSKHGYAARVQLPGHRIVVERKSVQP